MKRRNRNKRRVSPLLFATTLPTIGLTLCARMDSASAQTAAGQQLKQTQRVNSASAAPEIDIWEAHSTEFLAGITEQEWKSRALYGTGSNVSVPERTLFGQPSSDQAIFDPAIFDRTASARTVSDSAGSLSAQRVLDEEDQKSDGRPTQRFVTVPASVAAPARAQTAPPAPTSPQTAPPAQTAPPVQPAPPVRPTGPVISEIIVRGNKTLNSTAIISYSRHNVGDPCRAETLNEMQINLYATQLFGFNSRNEEDAVKVSSEELNGKCRVTIEVDENPTITSVELTGTGPIKSEEVSALLHLKKGAVYSLLQFNRDVAEISNLYSRRGYIAIFPQESGIDAAGKFIVVIQVTRVGQITITGNKKTQRRVILREINTKVGDYFNSQVVNGDKRRLQNLDLFDDIRIADPQIDASHVGLTISVVEKRTGTVSAGAGYSNRSQLVGFAELTESNFHGRGQAVNLRAEVGGVTGRSSIELGFNEPYLDKYHTGLNLQLYDKTVYRFSNSFRNPQPDQGTLGNGSRYNEQRTGATLALSRPFRNNSYIAGVSLRAEDVRTDSLNLPIEDTQIINNGPIFVFATSLQHSTRDFNLDPVSGGFQTINVQFGTANLKAPRTLSGLGIPGIFGNVNFAKTDVDIRQFFNLSGKKRVKPDDSRSSVGIRLLLGGSTGTLPFFEQFFLGGGESLRGYRDDRFWGSNRILGSIELRQPLANKLKGVLFTDFGDAWGGSYSNVHVLGFEQGGFKLHASAGLGIRVVTPIGQLRLDYGYGDEGGRTHFSIGQTF